MNTREAPHDLTPSLSYSHEGRCAVITLRRPVHRNRLHREDLVMLRQHFADINARPQVTVAVLTAEVLPEQPVFCAGFHMGEHGQEDPEATFEQVADGLEALRPVTVCGLNGSVYGGATDLVLACDFSIGVTGMQARMPAVAIGLHYYPGGISRFVSRLGVVNAKRAFLGAETFSAEELLRIGFVGQLVAGADHSQAVQTRVAALLQLAPLALQNMKTSLNEVARGDFDVARLHERANQSRTSEDFRDAVLAFAEKRKPVFHGR